jgi:hypothetical protein
MTMTHYITYQRISSDYGIYGQGDYMATYVPCGPRGKRGGAVAPSTLLRVRKSPYYGHRDYRSMWWLAEVVVPGAGGPVVLDEYIGSTRDTAVRNAVRNTVEVAA